MKNIGRDLKKAGIKTGSFIFVPTKEDKIREKEVAQFIKNAQRAFKRTAKSKLKFDRAKEIVECFNDSEKYKRMIVGCFFPIERSYSPFETEQERIDRRYKQICDEFAKAQEERRRGR